MLAYLFFFVVCGFLKVKLLFVFSILNCELVFLDLRAAVVCGVLSVCDYKLLALAFSNAAAVNDGEALCIGQG